MIKRSVMGLVLGGLCVAGCAKTESADLLTSGIYAAITARASGDGNTTVSATLYVDDPNQLNFVELTGDDSLIATSGAVHQEMRQSELGNIVSHTAQFTGDAEGTAYTVDLIRSVDHGAPATTMTLPAGFTIAPPPAAASRNADLQLTYAPAGTGDAMVWTIAGGCITTYEAHLTNDSGVVSIPAKLLAPIAGSEAATCSVAVTLSRQRAGQLDPGYGKGGTALAEQVRQVSWSSTP